MIAFTRHLLPGKPLRGFFQYLYCKILNPAGKNLYLLQVVNER